jgi:hypothetical protein
MVAERAARRRQQRVQGTGVAVQHPEHDCSTAKRDSCRGCAICREDVWRVRKTPCLDHAMGRWPGHFPQVIHDSSFNGIRDAAVLA